MAAERRKRSAVTNAIEGLKEGGSVDDAVDSISREMDQVFKEAIETNAEKLTAKDHFGLFSEGSGEAPKLADGFERIIETTFTVADPFAEYEKLEADLHIGEQRGDYVVVNTHLDLAETNARKAFRLYLSAKIEAARFEKDSEIIQSAMWSAATSELQSEKDAKQRNKAITDGDVRMRAAEKFPDEWRSQEEKAAKVKAMLASMEDLALQWKSRCRSLQAMLGGMRR